MPIPQAVALPPLPFPEQDILFACADFNRFSLLRYDPRANRWSDELSGRDTAYLSNQTQPFSGSLMAPLPDDSGVLLSLADFDSDEIDYKIVSWRSRQEQLLLERDFILQLSPEPVQRQFDPSGRIMVFFNVTYAQTSDGQEMRVMPYSLDLEACHSGNCEAQLYDGFPHWSPDLSWLLLINLEEQNLITLRDERSGEEIPLGNGFSPFWLDDESFIYIRPVEDTEAGTGAIQTVEIVAASVDDPLNGTVLVDSAAISTAITGSDPTGTVGIHSVVAHPGQPDWLFFSATLSHFAEPQTHHILSFRNDTGEVSVLVNLDDSSLTFPFQIIQNGQLLAVQTFSSSAPTGLLTLIPLNPAEKTADSPIDTYSVSPTSYGDWSQDGRWLLITGQDSFRLIAPGHNYDQTITHDLGACTDAAWINAPG